MAFDTGVGFAFTGRDAGLGKAAGSAASSFAGIGSAVDNVGASLERNAEHVKGFLKEFSQSQIDRIQSGLDDIASSASINETSLEGMAVAAAKTAKPIVASLGLTGAAAKKAKGQIVGLSIGLNVGAEAVGNAVKAMKHFGTELKAVGIKDVKTATKFQEVSGIQIDKLGAQVAGLSRSWGLTEDQLGTLVPWVLEAGKAFGYGTEAIAGMEQVTTALDDNLSKVLLKNGPAAISKFTKGIYSLALVSSEALGMEFPEALGGSIDVFNRLAGDVATFQKTFSGLSQDFGPLAERLGLAIGDWDTAFKLVQEDPMEFAHQLAKLAKEMDLSTGAGAAFLDRLKLTLGDDSKMIRFLMENADAMDKSLGKLKGVEAGADSLKKFASAGFSTGRSMAEVLDLMRQRAQMRFMRISKSMWKPYMKSLQQGYKSSTEWLSKLASDTEPGGIGYLVNAASMGMRFGLGGVIRGLFPPAEGSRALGMIDSLGDSLVGMLPHLTALGALGFRPSMLAAPFKFALGPLKALTVPLAGFSTLMGGLPKMALSIFGPLGALALAVGGFTLLGRKWMDGEGSKMETFIKKDLPIAMMRGFGKLTMGKAWTDAMDKDFKDMESSDIWKQFGKMAIEAIGKGLSLALEAFEVGTEVMVDAANQLADGLMAALDKVNWEKFGSTIAKIAVNLTGAIGDIIAKTPRIVAKLVRGIVSGLSKVDWKSALKGTEKELGGAAEGVGETMQAGIGWENILGAGALIGVPLLLRKFKKIRKEGGSIIGGMRKDVAKGVPPEAAGLPKCIPLCSGAATQAGPVKGAARAAATARAPAMAPMLRPVPLHPSQRPGYGGMDPSRMGLDMPPFKKAPFAVRLTSALGLTGLSKNIDQVGHDVGRASTSMVAAIRTPFAKVGGQLDTTMRGIDKNVTTFQKQIKAPFVSMNKRVGKEMTTLEKQIRAPFVRLKSRIRKDMKLLDKQMRGVDRSIQNFHKRVPEVKAAFKSMGKVATTTTTTMKKGFVAMGAATKRAGMAVGGAARRAGGMAKAGYGRVAGYKGMAGMGAMGGLAPGMMMGGMAMAGEEIGLKAGLGGYGMAGLMGGPAGLAMAAGLTGAGGAINEFKENWEDTMARVQESGGDTSSYLEETFALSFQSISAGMDDMTLGLTKKIRDATSEWLGINTVTGEQIGQVFKILFSKVTTGLASVVSFFVDSFKNFFGGIKTMFTSVVGIAKAAGKIAISWLKAKGATFAEWGKLVMMKTHFFFKKVWFGIQETIDNLVLGSMQMFKGVIGGFYALLEKIPESAKKVLRQFEGFKTFENFVVSVGSTIETEIDKKMDSIFEKRKKQQKELAGDTLAITNQQVKLLTTQAKGVGAVNEALAEQGKVLEENFSSLWKAAKKTAKGGAVLAGTALIAGTLGPGAILAGGVISAFLPESAKQKLFSAVDAGTALDISKRGEKEMVSLESKLMKMQNDAADVTEEAAEKATQASMEAGQSMLLVFDESRKELGLTKKQLYKVQGEAAATLESMAKVSTPEEAVGLMEKAVAAAPTVKQKQALARMLGASGAVMMGGGALKGMAGRMKGELAKEGITFAEAISKASADIAAKAAEEVKGKGKKKAKAKAKAMEEAVKTYKEAKAKISTEAPVAPAPAPGFEVAKGFYIPTPTAPGAGGGSKQHITGDITVKTGSYGTLDATITSQ